MGYVIVLYSDGYKTQIGTCFFNGYIDDGFDTESVTHWQEIVLPKKEKK